MKSRCLDNGTMDYFDMILQFLYAEFLIGKSQED